VSGRFGRKERLPKVQNVRIVKNRPKSTQEHRQRDNQDNPTQNREDHPRGASGTRTVRRGVRRILEGLKRPVHHRQRKNKRRQEKRQHQPTTNISATRTIFLEALRRQPRPEAIEFSRLRRRGWRDGRSGPKPRLCASARRPRRTEGGKSTRLHEE